VWRGFSRRHETPRWRASSLQCLINADTPSPACCLNFVKGQSCVCRMARDISSMRCPTTFFWKHTAIQISAAIPRRTAMRFSTALLMPIPDSTISVHLIAARSSLERRASSCSRLIAIFLVHRPCHAFHHSDLPMHQWKRCRK
jgi:hypothetical protein